MVTAKKSPNVKSMVLCALFSVLIAAGAFIKIPLGSLPITLQFLFTNLAGLLLGKKRGAVSVGLYIFIGLVGVPIFTGGGGIAYVLQPSFGFLLGMVLGTFCTGWLAEKKERFWSFIAAGVVGAFVMYLVGLVYLHLITKYYMGTPVELKALLVSYCLIFLPGDALKITASALLTKKLRPLLP